MFKTKQDGKYRKIESISYYHDDTPLVSNLYLARLEKKIIEDDKLQIKIKNLDLDSFNIYQNGTLVGTYNCQDNKDKNSKYFHFKKYVFSSC